MIGPRNMSLGAHEIFEASSLCWAAYLRLITREDGSRGFANARQLFPWLATPMPVGRRR